jgi:hypothetical protein
MENGNRATKTEDLIAGISKSIKKVINDKTVAQDDRILFAKLAKYLQIYNGSHAKEIECYLVALNESLVDPISLAVALENAQEIRLLYYTTQPGPWGRFVKRFGSSAAVAIIAGAIASSILIAVVLAIAWVVGASSSSQGASLAFMDLRVLKPLLLSAWIGATVSLAIGLNSYYSIVSYNPGLVFANGFFRPIIALAMSVAVLAILLSKVVTVQGLPLNPIEDSASYYAIWVIGFLSGFSERFAGDLVTRAGGIFSGK